MKIVLAGGGTAGHVNPLLATAKALETAGADIMAVGTQSGLETDLVPEAGYSLELIPRVPFPRRPNRAALRFPRDFRQAINRGKEILHTAQADVCAGFGGYVSTPMYLAARSCGIPVVVHEGNALPGLANRWGARFADAVALTFPSTPLNARHGETVVTGLPLRQQITQLVSPGRDANRKQIAQEYGLDPDRSILLVTGGSSGAQHINEIVADAGQILTQAGIQVLHITGRGKDLPVRAATAELPGYVVLDYLTQMDRAYAIADLVVTRSGAGMVAELSTLGIPAVFVPLPVGNGEQARNAKDVVDAGGAVLVDNADFTVEYVANQLVPMFVPEILAQMSEKAQQVFPADAAQTLADLILRIGANPAEEAA